MVRVGSAGFRSPSELGLAVQTREPSDRTSSGDPDAATDGPTPEMRRGEQVRRQVVALSVTGLTAKEPR